MDWQKISLLIPYVVSFGISFGIGLYAFHQRSTRAAYPFALLAWSQASWTLGYIFELNSDSLDGKIFWDNFQFLGTAGWTIFVYSFAIQFTERRSSFLRFTWVLTSIFMAIYLILVFTDGLHNLIRPEATLIEGEVFDELDYPFTAATWTAFLIFVFVFITALVLLGSHYFRVGHLYRGQMIVIFTGALIPFIGVTLTIFGLQLTFHRDTSPLTFAVGNSIVAWGLFRYRLLDIIPIARARVVDHIQDAVVVVDLAYRVVDLNPAAERSLGQSAKAAIGKSVLTVFAQWKDLIEQFKAVDQTQAEITYDVHGMTQYARLTISPIYDGTGNLSGRVYIIHDITDLKRGEQQLAERNQQLEALNRDMRNANERLRELSQVKDDFVSNVSHELRTPIASLRLHQTLLKMEPERADQYLGAIEREVERLARTIDDLLYLSRLDQERVELKFATVDLNQMTAAFVEDRTPLANKYNINLEYHQQSDTPKIPADEGLLVQVLSILVTNAIAYTPAGGVVTVETCTEIDNNDCWAGFRVQDTGPGIPPEEHPQLFSRFFRGKSGRESGVSGTGLGLAIAKEVVDRHSGRIAVDSDGVAGKGTTFVVLLPVKSPPNLN